MHGIVIVPAILAIAVCVRAATVLLLPLPLLLAPAITALATAFI